MKKAISLIFLLTLTFPAPVLAQVIPAQQKAGSLENLRLLQERDFTLRKQIQRKKKEVEAPIVPELTTDDIPDTDKILIKNIQVKNVTLLTTTEINKITDPFLGKELTLRDMQKIANTITDTYRQKGYVTSRAVLPPQRIELNTLEINVIEGQLGSVNFEGNKYFSTGLLTKYLELDESVPFDYVNLQTQLDILNEHPDRNVSAVLMPGDEPGETDVLLNVAERLPIHVGIGYDNYLSRFLDESRYMATITHNNLTGQDDRLTLRYQRGNNADEYTLASFRYIYPITKEFDIGFHGSKTETHLGGSLSSLDAEGDSEVFGIYGIYELVNRNFTILSLNGGFDYKDITNSQSGVQTSQDRLRNLKIGFNFDRLDQLGRWIVANETSFGIPSFMGGGDSIDPDSSRVGSGSEFVKSVLDVLRLQNIGWDATLMAKGQLQFSSRTLPASEQYLIGGISNVRGYPQGEFIGDSGQSFTAELTVPPYFIPKTVSLPFYGDFTFYQAVRIAAFWDWGRIELRNPQAGEKKARTLHSAGAGLRLSLPDDLSLRYDVAWPIDERASDGDTIRHWFKFAKQF